ncbi:MAG: hypothetical protein R3B70_27980 [Polyangiaceae bacterium]
MTAPTVPVSASLRRSSKAMSGALTAPVLIAVGLAAASLGCSAGESIDPVGTTTTTSTPPETTTDPGPTGSPPKRTVTLRNPLGGPANNLLVDGDFELSIANGGGQYGFRMFNTSGTAEIAMTAETGGLCRSGLTCARFKKGQILIGRGTAAANGKGHFFSLHARLPEDAEGASCTDIDVLAIECDTFKALKKAATDKDLDGGWCRYSGTFAPQTSSVCLYVSNTLKTGVVALLDSAVLAPNDGTVAQKTLAPVSIEPGALATMERVRDLLRRSQRFGAEAPTRAPLR